MRLRWYIPLPGPFYLSPGRGRRHHGPGLIGTAIAIVLMLFVLEVALAVEGALLVVLSLIWLIAVTFDHCDLPRAGSCARFAAQHHGFWSKLRQTRKVTR